MSSQSHELGTQSYDYTRRPSPALAGLERLWGLTGKLWEAWTFVQSMCSPWRQYGQRSALETAEFLWHPWHVLSPKPSKHSGPAHSNHSKAMNPVRATTQEGLTLRLRDYPIPRQGLVGVAVSIAGTYLTTFEAAQISEATSHTALTPRYTLGIHTSMACPAAWCQSRVGVAEPGDSRSSVRDRVDLHSRLVLRGIETTAEAWTCNISDTVCTAIDDMSWEPARAPFTSALPCFLGQSSWCGRQEKKKKRTQLAPGQPSGLLLQQLGIRSHPQ